MNFELVIWVEFVVIVVVVHILFIEFWLIFSVIFVLVLFVVFGSLRGVRVGDRDVVIVIGKLVSIVLFVFGRTLVLLLVGFDVEQAP